MNRVFSLYFSDHSDLSLVRTTYAVSGMPTIQSDRGTSYFESATRTQFVWGNSSQALAVLCLRTAAAQAGGAINSEDVPWVMHSAESNCAKTIWKSFYRGTERSVASVFFGTTAAGDSGASALMVCSRNRGGVRTVYFKPARVTKLQIEVFLNGTPVVTNEELESLAWRVEQIFESRRANDPRVKRTEGTRQNSTLSSEGLGARRAELVEQVKALEVRLGQLQEMVALAEQRADVLVGQLAGKLRAAVKGEAGVSALMRVMGEQIVRKPAASSKGGVLH